MQDLDVTTYTYPVFQDPLISIAFTWELVAIAFNLFIIGRSLTGWILNRTATRQVIFACSLAVIWLSICITQFFVQHRALSLLNNWTGYPLTLLVGLQHIELLKLFVSLSNYWTEKKCRILQICLICIHIIICLPEYIWPFGLENNATVREVIMSKSYLLSAEYLG